ncbi:MAG: hypothetical protein ACJ796_07675 [Gemmatimonadaceae bacterium]
MNRVLQIGCVVTLGATAACFPKHTAPVGTGIRVEPAMLEIAHAAGAQVRRERRSFVVYPTFLDASANVPSLEAAQRARAEQLLDAFRRGAEAQYVDTMHYHHRAALAALRDSLLMIVTLTGEPTVDHDSAYVDVLSQLMRKEPAPVEFATYRYFFTLRDGAWQFIRRILTYAT